MVEGCGTALVTPFRADSSLDEATLRKLVRRQVEAGINFLVPCGTTGESPTLTRAEHLRVVEITLEEARGVVPILAKAALAQPVIPAVKPVALVGTSSTSDSLLAVRPESTSDSSDTDVLSKVQAQMVIQIADAPATL